MTADVVRYITSVLMKIYCVKYINITFCVQAANILNEIPRSIPVPRSTIPGSFALENRRRPLNIGININCPLLLEGHKFLEINLPIKTLPRH